MANFDFHNNLSPIEFERLVRDILQQKFKDVSFRTYKAGRDGGIDIKSISGSQIIICQTKLYQQHFPQLKRSLQKEIHKTQKLKPHKYILATSCSLTDNNIQEILNMFSSLGLSEEDIWDKERLNQLLGLNEYKEVLKNHYKLFLTDLFVLEETLKKTVNNAVIQYSLIELEKIKNEIRYYVETKTTHEIHTKLLKEKVVIISGAAGTGKTTTARIIINSMLNAANSSKEFYKVSTIEETLNCFDPNKSQLFLLDDYWGQFIEKIYEPNIAGSDKMLSFLERVKRSNKHYVIITSRDYILKNEGIVKQTSLKNTINNHLFIIKIDTLTHHEKAHIFIQHLYHSDFDRTFLSGLYYSTTLEEIVKNRNFNPRLVSQFIHQVYPNKIANEECPYDNYFFYSYLKKYLDNPNEFWEHLLNVQAEPGKLILMILATTGGYTGYKELMYTFEKCLPLAIAKGLQVKISDFTSTIKSLEDTFLDIHENSTNGHISINFKNGSVGDYLINYLQKNIAEWSSILIRGAVLFDQLTVIFTAHPPFQERRVLLTGIYKNELKERLLTELLTLPWKIADLNNEAYYPENEIVSRLFTLTNIFNIEEETDVQKYVLEKTMHLIHLQLENNQFSLTSYNLPELSPLINNLKKFLQFDIGKFIASLFFSIDSFVDYEHFIKFSKVYPDEYNSFFKKYKKNVRYTFEEVLMEDLYFFIEN